MQGYFSYLREDTVYKKRFDKAIRNFIISYSKAKKAERKAEAMQKIGISYYYLKDYENASIYLRKSIMAKSKLGDLWYAKLLIRQQQLDSAKNVLTRFCQRDALSFDSISHVINIDIKNGH